MSPRVFFFLFRFRTNSYEWPLDSRKARNRIRKGRFPVLGSFSPHRRAHVKAYPNVPALAIMLVVYLETTQTDVEPQRGNQYTTYTGSPVGLSSFVALLLVAGQLHNFHDCRSRRASRRSLEKVVALRQLVRINQSEMTSCRLSDTPMEGIFIFFSMFVFHRPREDPTHLTREASHHRPLSKKGDCDALRKGNNYCSKSTNINRHEKELYVAYPLRGWDTCLFILGR